MRVRFSQHPPHFKIHTVTQKIIIKICNSGREVRRLSSKEIIERERYPPVAPLFPSEKIKEVRFGVCAPYTICIRE